ncbi:MAG: hypothetical protein AB7F64_04405, partial [Gammaproteobacteria bacterium]
MINTQHILVDDTLNKIKTMISTSEHAYAINMFRALLLDNLCDFSLEEIALIMAEIPHIFKIISHEDLKLTNLFQQARNKLEEMNPIPYQIIIDLHQYYAEALVANDKIDSAIDCLSSSLWITRQHCKDKENATQSSFYDLVYTRLQTLLIKESSQNFSMVFNIHELIERLKRVDWLASYWLTRNQFSKINEIYEIGINPITNAFLHWTEDELSRYCQKQETLDQFRETAFLVQKVADLASKHHQWDLAIKIYFKLLDYCIKEARNFEQRKNFETQIQRLTDYTLGKIVPTQEETFSHDLIAWRTQLKDYRADFENNLTCDNVIEKQAVFSHNIQSLLQTISAKLVYLFGHKSSHDWQLLGLGSLAYGSMAPYSDFDCAILVSTEEQRTETFFLSFIHALQTLIKAIGEPNGFWLDEGDFRYLSNPRIDDRYLLNTPEGFVHALNKHISDGSFILSNELVSLLRPVTIYRYQIESKLLHDYQNKLQAYFSNLRIFDQFINANYRHYAQTFSFINSPPINIKDELIRALELWSQLAVLSQRNITVSRLDTFKKLSSILDPDFYSRFLKTWQFVHHQRCLRHFASHRQEDKPVDNIPLLVVYHQRIIWPLFQYDKFRTSTEKNLHPIIDTLQKPLEPSKLDTLLDEMSQSSTLEHAVVKVYHLCSQKLHLEDRRWEYYLHFSHHPALCSVLEQVPNTSGFRGIERNSYEGLHRQLMTITCEELSEAKLIWIFQGKRFERWLTKEAQNILWNNERQEFNHHYKVIHRHKVIRICLDDTQNPVDIHLKCLPDRPLMDYAIDILSKRVIGHGTPANLLLRFELADKSKAAYPLLVTQSMGKETLSERLEQEANYAINQDCFTDLILFSLLISSGDAAPRNFVLNSFNGKPSLTSIDNDQQFVIPVIKKKNSKSEETVIQWRNVLFSLAQAKQPLSREALQRFTELPNAEKLINAWFSALTKQDKIHQELFSLEEQKQLYALNNETRFTTNLMVRPGIFAQLLINFNYLQIHIRNLLNHSNTLPTALDLLSKIFPRIHHYHQNAFRAANTTKGRYQLATQAPEMSMTSNQSIEASLGLLPTFEELESDQSYQLKSVKRELKALKEYKPDFSKLVLPNGKPDIALQTNLLKILGLQSHQAISLSHCAALTDELVTEVLSYSEGQ